MSQITNATGVTVIDQPSPRSMILPVFLFILAMLYDISPIDIIPDIPVIGYIDDFFITAIATLNLLQKWLQDSSVILASMLGLAKWLVIFTGIIAVSIIGMAVLGIVKLFIS